MCVQSCLYVSMHNRDCVCVCTVVNVGGIVGSTHFWGKVLHVNGFQSCSVLKIVNAVVWSTSANSPVSS